jgi:D-glycero-D-manno-heptose 1,7-bisphosphate phosphatase
VTRRAVFLDRDGVLNEMVRRDGERGSPRRVEEFRVVAGAPAAVARLRARGFVVFVVTNQPDLARGRVTPSEMDRIMSRLLSVVALDDVALCPHDDADACTCRKPKPGMLQALAERWQVDLGESFMVGDTWKDVAAGRAAGCRTVLIGDAPLAGHPADAVVASLPAAVTAIETMMEQRMGSCS